MLRPRTFIILISSLLIIPILLFYLKGTALYNHTKNKLAQQWQVTKRAPRNVTVIFLDITDSDTAKAWTNRPFREQFAKTVNSYLLNAQDVLAAYIIHGKTRDVQPFWTNYPLSAPPIIKMDDSTSAILAGIQKEKCITAFDTLTALPFLTKATAADSMLTCFTDMIGALQQSALYFRAYANNVSDIKRVIFFSDTKENVGTTSGDIKLNNIGSVTAARAMAENAFTQIKTNTDIHNELKYADIHFLSPNIYLYYNEERNLRRIFWETLLIKKLHCNTVHYF